MGKKGDNKKGSNNNKVHDRKVKQGLRKKADRLKYGDAKWKQSFNAFLEQLEPQGFTIKDVAGDGNCLFRAFADQLEDNPEQHMKYRQNIITFIEKNKDMYAPFIDDEEGETFEDYIAEMRKNASWGGNIEIQAASLIYQCNITIHQFNQPRWEIINYVGDKYRMIHLSYHNDEHYASVRPTRPPSLKDKQQQKEDGPPKPNMEAMGNTYQTDAKNYIDDVTYEIMNATGVTSTKMVREALDDCDGNIEAAIDYLIALSATIDFDNENIDNNTTTTTTTTTTTSSSSNKPSKESKNPYKEQVKLQKQQQQQQQQQQKEEAKHNGHQSNSERKRQQMAAKEKENNNKQRQNHNIDRNSIVDDSTVDLGTLRI
ncbi:OTU domain containing protein [Heterostelium album PN500]|uniref:OTU domain containing protein n=1 Tax=Heterostelium pallidum (strain ATCC 26659 / Pp 5 / PN500) TaxID=670386 RepID=D3B1E5_HETP5|nr:OTU domain containing protein [Heterostelium album PN500]EFA85119.1 OTU domain containing protein [Heterostelium album PN500]|eukprot:XP_020437228.1 OTU domain containing protein [Heterostelium album PN500]